MKQMKRDETAISVILYTQQGRMKGRSHSGNVIQIRMTERELELKYVPVSFFVKKTEKKG